MTDLFSERDPEVPAEEPPIEPTEPEPDAEPEVEPAEPATPEKPEDES